MRQKAVSSKIKATEGFVGAVTSGLDHVDPQVDRVRSERLTTAIIHKNSTDRVIQSNVQRT